MVCCRIFGASALLISVACAPQVAGPDDSTSSTPADASPGSPPAIDAAPPPCDQCTDFPADPIWDGDAPSNAPDLFGDSDNHSGSGGPCLLEPQVGALFPRNWLRPRFRFTPEPGHDLFEIRLQADRQVNDLVVFTTNTVWTMPDPLWEGLAAHIQLEPITVTVRSLSSASPGVPALGTQGPFSIAPVNAEGSLVYWATIGERPDEAWLKGFVAGEEEVLIALSLDQVAMSGRRDQGGNPRGDGRVDCIGCHTSTPDGKAVAFTDHWPWGNAMASIVEDEVGNVPQYLSPAAAETLNQPWLGVQTFSPAHWSDDDRVVITSYGRSAGEIWDGRTWSDTPDARLAWFDLESPAPDVPLSQGGAGGAELAAAEGVAFGFLARDGDASGAMMPDWSHDGLTVVYTSTNAGKDGRLATGPADLYEVPYNNREGGVATAVDGASDPAFCEYYPAYSPDDSLIAFNRIPGGQDMYYADASEVFVIPSQGGDPIRLAANDPPQCSGVTSPGIINSWPKWAPSTPIWAGKTYYWLVFSSARDGYDIPMAPHKRASQLYMTAIVVTTGEVTNHIETYPAVYLWNQSTDESNHTPAWDAFELPDVD